MTVYEWGERMLTTTSPTRPAGQPAPVEAPAATTEVVPPAVLKKLVKAKHGTPCTYVVGC